MSFLSVGLLLASGGDRPIKQIEAARGLVEFAPKVSTELAGMSEVSIFIGKVISWLMFLVPAFAAIIIVLGMAYVAIPPLRNILDGGRGAHKESTGGGESQGSQGGMDMGGYGGGGYGGGYGGGGGYGQSEPQSQGAPKFGMQLVPTKAITISLTQDGVWTGLKIYFKESLMVMVAIGLILAITSMGTLFGFGFNIGVLVMEWLGGMSSSLGGVAPEVYEIIN
jgi:hypothetical protein